MNYYRFVLGTLATNCYLLWSGQEAGIIDPGGDVAEISKFIKTHNLNLRWIINTHGHGDHIVGNEALMKEFGVPLFIHAADRMMLGSAINNLSVFLEETVTSPEATRELQHGDEIILGDEIIQIIATPGHTQGGISLYTGNLLFSGDTLFAGDIGRTDLPGGDHAQLVQMIKERLLILPPETTVLPGHEESSTIGKECRDNPELY